MTRQDDNLARLVDELRRAVVGAERHRMGQAQPARRPPPARPASGRG